MIQKIELIPLPKTNHKSKNGFTLIELSIVLVIIGLIVGGVLVGRDLIKTAEIRAQITQIEEIKTAINTFIVKYGYLPGDMPPSQASQLGFFTFTGAQAGNGCVAAGIAFGNGDGIINGSGEKFPFWSHLSDAKLIKGNYGGTAGSLLVASAPTCITGPGGPITGYPSDHQENELFFPRSKLANNIGSISIMGNRYTAPANIPPPIFDATNRNNIIFLADMINGDDILSSYEAYQIDSKIDDGMPASGNAMVTSADYPPCTTSGVVPIQYDLSVAAANQLNCFGLDFLF